ncbi:MAG: FmdE family protein [Methanobacterium sp.]|nr:FmdE family protein [Methanobacterium sp.]
MEDFETLLGKGREFHGEVCPGIVMGTRIAMAGMRELSMDPSERNRDLMVYVEIDRCMADAVQAVTGITMGHRTLKYRDYGKFAATFVDMATGKAFRVSAVEGPKVNENDKSEKSSRPDMKEIVQKLSKVPEEDLLVIEEVKVDIPPQDIPGFPKYRAYCDDCGDRVLDRREIIIDGKTLCRACAEGPYYQKVE